MLDIEGKVVVVTGGLGLLGQTFVKAINENKGIAIIADIQTSEDENSYIMDITSKKSIIKVLDQLHQKYGRVDALVNNAYPRNKNYGRSFFDVEYEDFSENISLNIGGYFLVSQQFSHYFIKQGYGNIINIASIYGVVAPRFEVYDNTSMTMPVEYAAIKSAIIHLTKYLVKFLKNKNIRVNALSPGGIIDNQNTQFLQQYKKNCSNKGMLEKEDLSGSLLFLLSDMSKQINGQNLIVDDGFVL